MVGHGGSSASSYLADPTSPIPSHCDTIVVTSTVRVKFYRWGIQLGSEIILYFSSPVVKSETIHCTFYFFSLLLYL